MDRAKVPEPDGTVPEPPERSRLVDLHRTCLEDHERTLAELEQGLTRPR